MLDYNIYYYKYSYKSDYIVLHMCFMKIKCPTYHNMLIIK